MEVLMNELSLDGQYETPDEFFESINILYNTMNLLKESGLEIYRYSSLFYAKITKDMQMKDLKWFRSDVSAKFKTMLMKIIEKEPFWDKDMKQKDEVYFWQNKNVSTTALAEAYARDSLLLSFDHRDFKDCYLEIRHYGLPKNIFSVSTKPCALKYCLEENIISKTSYMVAIFEGTRLDLTYMKNSQDLEQLESNEFEIVERTLWKFIELDSWDEIQNDKTMKYKHYSPLQKKKNIFAHTEFQDKKIYKFHCGGHGPVLRCFGYRENDCFFVIRLDRDHKVSDFG